MARNFPYAPLLTETEETSVPQQVQKLSAWVNDYFQDTWGFFWKESRLAWANAQVSDWGEVNEANLNHALTKDKIELIFILNYNIH